jgi:hypothetical protein
MGTYRNLLGELLEHIRQSRGDTEMKKVFEGNREAGEEAMSREVLLRILDGLPAREREAIFAAHADLKNAFESREGEEGK